MSRPSLVLGIVAATFLATTTATPVNALTYDKLTFLTFSAPVQIPGMTLGAGTYRFRLANPDTGRNVMQVVSNDGYYVYAMFHTIPDYRVTVTEEPTVTFREAPAGVAPPVKSLFYGGETFGYEFIYPHGGPNLIPKVVPQPEITYTPIETAPIVEAAAEPSAPAAVATAEPVIEPAVEPVPEPALPATASPVPVAALGGALSLVLGFGVGVLRRHSR